ncbi:hypothetical protein [Cellulomonas sp. HZM]|uniref:hypothetical protein n=1 Tax=Cellulomonas sp. HZM TaxID=1454010 RepID=UPI0004933D63|nr:hypothetical protein [Cellulomonas sp. HZM]
MTLLLAATPSPTPSPSGIVTAAQGGSPGFLGFVFTFVLALAAAGLFLSLTKQLRKVDRRAKALGDDDEDGTPRTGMVDAGAGGPDLEVDAAPSVRREDDEPR